MLSFGLIERSPAPRPGAVSGKKGTRRRYCTGFPRRCYPFRIWGSVLRRRVRAYGSSNID
jgi:hypothetical protein